MALPTTNLKITDIKTVLGATTNKVSDLCTHSNINMWSRRKPVQDSRVEVPLSEVGNGNNNDFGLTIPVYTGDDTKLTTYTKPTYNFRLGDFRGYNHDAILPIILPNAPASLEKREHIFVALASQQDGKNISMLDFGNDLRLGVMVYDGNGGLIGSASASSAGGSSVTVDLTGLPYSSLTFKFCLTNYYKEWGLTGMTALYEVPRAVVGENQNWEEIALIAYNPPTAVPVFNITHNPNERKLYVDIQTSTYTGTIYLQYLDSNNSIAHTSTFNITSANTTQTFEETSILSWIVGGESYTVKLWLDSSPIGAFDAETTFTAFQIILT